MKTVPIVQSNLYDDMQPTKNDWRNRNKIKTPKGVEWIKDALRYLRLVGNR
jgi:WbqC-like protein family